MTQAERLKRKVAVLDQLKFATETRQLATEQQYKLMDEARNAGCTLREIGEVTGISFSHVRLLLQKMEEPVS